MTPARWSADPDGRYWLDIELGGSAHQLMVDTGLVDPLGMVGFRNRAPGSQRLPPGLPGVAAPDVGDFLALLANRRSNAVADDLLTLAATYVPQPPVLALKTYLGIERYFGHLLRSDHAPFWEAGIPAVMWTDTSEFRNPHYHRPSDTPDTLDYDFLGQVAKLALARAASRARTGATAAG